MLLHFLYLLILIPFFFVAHYFYLRSKKRKLKEFASAKAQEVIMPELSIGKQRLKFVLLNIAFALLVFAAANPQYGTSVGKKERRGTDLVICLDISNSMLAEDIQPNRLLRAKKTITRRSNAPQKSNPTRHGLTLNLSLFTKKSEPSVRKNGRL